MPYDKKTRAWLDWDGEIIRTECWWEYRPPNAGEKEALRKKRLEAAKARERLRRYAYLEGVMHYQIGAVVLHTCECGVYTQMGSLCSKCSHTISSRDWDDPTFELNTDVQRMNLLESLFISGKIETDRFLELHDAPSNWKRFDHD